MALRPRLNHGDGDGHDGPTEVHGSCQAPGSFASPHVFRLQPVAPGVLIDDGARLAALLTPASRVLSRPWPSQLIP